MTPNWFEFLMLGLAAWSTFHLLAHDDILDRPRRWVLRLGKDWKKEGDALPDDYRLPWAQFLVCPYCAGMWIWMFWIAFWWIVPSVALAAAAFIGGRSLVIAGQKLLGKLEDAKPSKDAEAISDGLFEVAEATTRAARRERIQVDIRK
jgi:hypothetical protein